MKTKPIYTALMCLSLTWGTTNAMQTLTDGKENGNQLAPYTGTTHASPNSQALGMTDFTEFKGDVFSGYTETGSRFVEVGKSEKGILMLKAEVAYKGYDQQELAVFQNNIKFLLANPGLVLGMSTAPIKEIKINPEDSIYVTNLQKLIADNFFTNRFDDYTVLSSMKFKDFFKTDTTPINGYRYSENPFIYAFMYYFDNSQAEPVEVSHKYTSYGNFKFEFSPCADTNVGTQLSIGFEPSMFGYPVKAEVDKSSNDTLKRNFSYGYTVVPFSFKFALFKLDEAAYRMNVTMSKTDGPLSDKFLPQKITNVTLKVKK